ncbi:hypothetical protein [Microbacterium testaceum]|uniref:glycosyltransferase family protein n=1 Tax=Microbacterium testaceum TaxID=2033 RepID=UPI0012467219|nr:hypothetical protein [Microbacterium testaceum]
MDTSVGDHLPDAHRVPALYAYLIADPRRLTISPVWDAAGYLERHPARAAERGGAVGAAWRRRNIESLPIDPPAGPPVPWSHLHSRVLDATSRARRGQTDAESWNRSGRYVGVEYFLILDADEWDFDESIALAAELAGEPDSGVTIVQRGGRVEDWAQTVLLAEATYNIRAIRTSGSTPASESIDLADGCHAEVVVWRGPNVDATADTLRGLAATASRGAVVGPLWLDGDGTIAAAGAASEGRLLAGHPREDADELPGAPDTAPPAIAGATFAAPRTLATFSRVDSADHAAWASLDARLRGIPVSVRTDVSVRTRSVAPLPDLPAGLDGAKDLISAAGWTAVADGPMPRLRRRLENVTLEDGMVVPSLRWALRTAAPVGPRGEWWGDVHFARALADALRKLGQNVVVDAYPARNRSTRHLDDVTVALRGPEPIDPSPYGLSVLWIISHPDDIDLRALSGFGLIYAASTPWAARATAESGRLISPLLQCTDPSRFRPSGRARTSDIVFVGTARGIHRPSIVEPVRAGIPVRVYGPDWRGWIPASSIAGTGVPNADLPGLYESASVVLNDHWPSMQRHGFIANRPYDVVAAGGRVISDEVTGISEVFQGAVATYRTTDELLDLLRGDLDDAFPTPEHLADVSRTIRERDSFLARARTLLHDVTATLG